MTIFFLFITLLVIIINYVLYSSIVHKRSGSDAENNPIPISIIVAAKNEESNITKLLESVSTLNYPDNCYEIIVVDDNSSDNTRKIVEQFEHIPHLKLLTVKSKVVPGKKGALLAGVNNASFDNIAITDADCFVNSGWLISISNKFNEGYDIVIGPATYIESYGLTNGLARYESIKSHLLIFGMTSFGHPYSARGANFAYTKKAYNIVGGYAAMQQTLSGDDDLFIREAIKNKLKVGYHLNEKSIVQTASQQTISSYLNQKGRHTTTSNYYTIKHKIFLSVWHFANLIMLFLPFLISWYDFKLLIFIPIKLLIDAIISVIAGKLFYTHVGFINSFLLSPIYEFSIIANYLRGTFFKKSLKWKNNSL